MATERKDADGLGKMGFVGELINREGIDDIVQFAEDFMFEPVMNRLEMTGRELVRGEGLDERLLFRKHIANEIIKAW